MQETDQIGDQIAVGTRRVFYIPGYDPFPPRRYRELYRTQGNKQAAISGYKLSQKKVKGDPNSWQVRARTGERVSTARIEVMIWSDIVRDSMGHGIAATYWQLLRTAWVYISTGALARLMRLRKGPIIAALYPVVMLLVQLALAAGLGWAAGSFVGGLIWPPLGWIVGLALVAAALRLFRKHDRRLFAYYLMHDFAHTCSRRGAYPQALEARLVAFADRIAAALATDADEVLVVGHSSGAHLAVSVLADLIRAGRVPANGPDLALLTLGQCVPMASFLPDAHRLRRDLHDLSHSSALTWLDVSAPGDGCSFALCDPVAVSGVAPEDKRWPLVISAAFRNTLSDETWARLRWRFFRLHFQYLCAFDRPGDYDYFQITAGPRRLVDRFRGRNPSSSRIDTPVSRHTSIAA